MKHVLTLLIDWLGIARTEHVDEQDADLAVALACLRSDYEDLKARVDEYDLTPARDAACSRCAALAALKRLERDA